MNPRKLARLWQTLNRMRKSPQPARELIGLARKLGRIKFNRGKEPTWISVPFPHLRPVSIPHHKGDMSPGTRNSILDSLEYDLTEHEEKLDQSDDDATNTGNETND